jgi:hypothetical protein
MPITSLTTGPLTLSDEIEEEFFQSLGTVAQTGFRKISLGVTFYGDDATVVKLSRGLTLTSGASSKDAGSSFAQYTLLVSHPNDPATSSLLLPKCWTQKKMSINYAKTAVTQIEVTFLAQSRNRFENLFYMETLDELAVILGARSPI